MGLVGRTSGLGLLLLHVISLAVMTVIVGLYAGPFFALAERSAEELLAPAHYIEAVLGPQTLTETPLGETP